jgi:phospholipase/carboxylesterase
MHIKQVIQSGKQTGEATKALVMLHGRGGSAEDILSLANYLPVNDFALFAPQATNNTWYPYSFLVEPKENEPWLSGALAVLKDVVADVQATGITTDNIYFLGFSQGACLTLEFVARNATRYGGVVAFTGGLIGDKIYEENYTGDFAGTPIFIGTSDPDPHIPVERVHASAEILNGMHAQVTKKIYKNMGHTISQDEINEVKALIFKES